MTSFGAVPGCPGFGVMIEVRGLLGLVLVRPPELPLFPRGRRYLGQGRLPRFLFPGLGDPRWICFPRTPCYVRCRLETQSSDKILTSVLVLGLDRQRSSLACLLGRAFVIFGSRAVFVQLTGTGKYFPLFQVKSKDVPRRSLSCW